MNKNELRNTILSQIQLPCIGKNWMQVEPVSGQMQTRQLQQAIDDLSWRGGGTLVLQPGVYRTGALHLKNGVELHLACLLYTSRLGKPGVTADIQFAAASLPVGLGVDKHLVFDVEDVPGVVYKDGSGTGGTQPVVLPGEQGSAHHLLHGT